jgi:hypothetical protein
MRSNRRRCSSGFKAVQKYFAKNKAVHVFLTFPHSTFSAKVHAWKWKYRTGLASTLLHGSTFLHGVDRTVVSGRASTWTVDLCSCRRSLYCASRRSIGPTVGYFCNVMYKSIAICKGHLTVLVPKLARPTVHTHHTCILNAWVVLR